MNIWELVSWGLWLASAAGVGSFLYGVALRVLGREEGPKFVMGGIASLLVAAFGWGLVWAIYEGAVPPIPYGWVFYAVAGVLLVSAGVYLAVGRMTEGAWSLIGALLVVGVGFFAASLASGVEIGPSGTVSVAVVASTTMLKSGEELTLTVIPAGVDPPYTVTVDWGDGSTSTGSTGTNTTFTKRYSIPEDRPADSFTIRVDVRDDKG
ncbi:MAG: hypothetical protein QW503_05420 [Sulfolobales archaeon]